MKEKKNSNELLITYKNIKYKFEDNQWKYFEENFTLLFMNNRWYTVINKDMIDELNKYIRLKKFIRINNEY